MEVENSFWSRSKPGFFMMNEKKKMKVFWVMHLDINTDIKTHFYVFELLYTHFIV